jgi:hypothetical protein
VIVIKADPGYYLWYPNPLSGIKTTKISILLSVVYNNYDAIKKMFSAKGGVR